MSDLLDTVNHGKDKLYFDKMMISTLMLNLYSASWLKQQFMDRHFVLFGHNIIILFNGAWYLLESAYTNFIIFGLTRFWLERKIYHTRWVQYIKKQTTFNNLLLLYPWPLFVLEILNIGDPMSAGPWSTRKTKGTYLS